MSKPYSVYLSEATMRMVRPNDALSARINQLAERYSMIVAAQTQAVTEEIGAENIAAMAKQWPRRTPREPVVGPTLLALEVAATISDELMRKIDGLSASSALTLIELIELEVAKLPKEDVRAA